MTTAPNVYKILFDDSRYLYGFSNRHCSGLGELLEPPDRPLPTLSPGGDFQNVLGVQEERLDRILKKLSSTAPDRTITCSGVLGMKINGEIGRCGLTITNSKSALLAIEERSREDIASHFLSYILRALDNFIRAEAAMSRFASAKGEGPSDFNTALEKLGTLKEKSVEVIKALTAIVLRTGRRDGFFEVLRARFGADNPIIQLLDDSLAGGGRSEDVQRETVAAPTTT